MDCFREISMPHTSQVRSRLPVAAGATVALFALALAGAALPTRAADTPPKPAIDATVKIKAFPPSIQVAAETAAAEKGDAAAQTSGGKRGESKQQAIEQAIEQTINSNLRFDTDGEFDTFVQKMPWVIGLIFLVVGSIFLTPIILLVGIIWYKLRKTRLQNEAMLALAERAGCLRRRRQMRWPPARPQRASRRRCTSRQSRCASASSGRTCARA